MPGEVRCFRCRRVIEDESPMFHYAREHPEDRSKFNRKTKAGPKSKP